MKDHTYHTVILAALLHDIGKFLHRGKGYSAVSGSHPEVSLKFVIDYGELFAPTSDINLLKTLVSRHHESPNMPEEFRVQGAPPEHRPLAWLISTADNLSSSERDEEEKREYKTTPLASVFSRIAIGDLAPPETVLNYHLSPLDPMKTFPEAFGHLDEHEMNDQLYAFASEWNAIKQRVDRNRFDIVFTHLLALLHRYTWCVPSNTQEKIPDVSLYDHLRTTSAIAACLFKYHETYKDFSEQAVRDTKTEKFLLVAGDVSGIQDYIFDLQTVGVGGAAKRLRARSFLVAQVSELACLAIQRQFNLLPVNVLMSSGGKFYMLLPNLPDAPSRLAAIQRDFNEWSLNEMHGRLAVHLAVCPASGENLRLVSGENARDFGWLLTQLEDILRDTKLRPLHDVLTSNGKWQPSRFVIEAAVAEDGVYCEVCKRKPGAFDTEEEAVVCSACSDDKKLGQVLPRAEAIAYYPNHTGKFRVAGLSFDLLESKQEPGSEAIAVSLLQADRPIKVYKTPILSKWLANYIPKAEENPCENCRHTEACSGKERPEPGRPLFFKCLSARAQGQDALAYLKADVDRLGMIFAFGLVHKDKKLNTVSRIATLSRMLDLFFSGWMDKILRQKFPNIYTVYSGGDDLLVIGPWSDVLDFAQTLNREFRSFTCNNPSITLSAGVTLAKSSTPVMHAATFADRNLDRSKDTMMRGAISSRDQITALGETLKWPLFTAAMSEGKQLANWLQGKQVSVGFARNLLGYAHMYNKFHSNRRKQVMQLRFLPLMTYDLERNIPPPNDRDPTKARIGQWAHTIKNQLMAEGHVPLRFIAQYALTANRGGGDHE